jgi:hypothetical protein
MIRSFSSRSWPKSRENPPNPPNPPTAALDMALSARPPSRGSPNPPVARRARRAAVATPGLMRRVRSMRRWEPSCTFPATLGPNPRQLQSGCPRTGAHAHPREALRGLPTRRRAGPGRTMPRARRAGAPFFNLRPSEPMKGLEGKMSMKDAAQVDSFSSWSEAVAPERGAAPRAQFRRQLAGMTYEQQVEAVRPPGPVQRQAVQELRTGRERLAQGVRAAHHAGRAASRAGGPVRPSPRRR